MSAPDLASARTFADVGELTARWLEGDLDRSPDNPLYVGGPDPETEGLEPLLADLNRAGWATLASQPASDGTGYDGHLWQQRAALTGFVRGEVLADRLSSACRERGLGLLVQRRPQPSWRRTIFRWRSWPVSQRRDDEGRWQATCWFGVGLDRRQVAEIYEEACPQAVRAMQVAVQVAVIDLEWGRAGALWSLLETFRRPS